MLNDNPTGFEDGGCFLLPHLLILSPQPYNYDESRLKETKLSVM